LFASTCSYKRRNSEAKIEAILKKPASTCSYKRRNSEAKIEAILKKPMII